MASSGKVVFLSGPSGVGKDTVIEAWRRVNPRIERVVACTTRLPREGEVDGVDYHFLSPREFELRAARGDFLEHKLVHGNHYATPIEGMKAALRRGNVAILKIDVQGTLEAKARLPEALAVFLVPPSEEELARRIRQRGTETEAESDTRLRNAREEIAQAAHYDVRIVNDDVDRVVGELEALVAQRSS